MTHGLDFRRWVYVRTTTTWSELPAAGRWKNSLRLAWHTVEPARLFGYNQRFYEMEEPAVWPLVWPPSTVTLPGTWYRYVLPNKLHGRPRSDAYTNLSIIRTKGNLTRPKISAALLIWPKHLRP